MKADKATESRTRRMAIAFACIVIASIGVVGAFTMASQHPTSAVDALAIEAHAILSEQGGHKHLTVNAIMINKGDEPLTVLTRPPESGISSLGDDTLVQFAFTGRLRSDGHLIVPSIQPYAPLTLRPGEATRLFVNVDGRLVQTLNDGARIRVEYRIRKDWGERFDLWHRNVETEAVVKANSTP